MQMVDTSKNETVNENEKQKQIASNWGLVLHSLQE